MPSNRLAGPIVSIILGAVLAACTSGASSSVPARPSSSPIASAVSAETTVHGVATASPVCPVERPGDPACAPRRVAGAILVVRRGGAEVARVTTGADGAFVLSLPAGDYTLVPQPVTGLLGTARPVPFSVGAGGPGIGAVLTVDYDTGIR